RRNGERLWHVGLPLFEDQWRGLSCEVICQRAADGGFTFRQCREHLDLSAFEEYCGFLQNDRAPPHDSLVYGKSQRSASRPRRPPDHSELAARPRPSISRCISLNAS